MKDSRTDNRCKVTCRHNTKWPHLQNQLVPDFCPSFSYWNENSAMLFCAVSLGAKGEKVLSKYQTFQHLPCPLTPPSPRSSAYKKPHSLCCRARQMHPTSCRSRKCPDNKKDVKETLTVRNHHVCSSSLSNFQLRSLFPDCFYILLHQFMWR